MIGSAATMRFPSNTTLILPALVGAFITVACGKNTLRYIVAEEESLLADGGYSGSSETRADASAPGNAPEPGEPPSGFGPDAGGEEISQEEANVACTEDSECQDVNECNGAEVCNDGVCAAGERLDDGAGCMLAGASEQRYCFNGNCEASRCGDGIVDPDNREDCDDGNPENGDGCEEDCTFSCAADTDCDDGLSCNGSETCDPETHRCAPGDNLDDGTSCGDLLVCRGGSCVSEGCGNGEVDDGEDCDDGNETPADGCELDCTWTCVENADCDDSNVCNGSETCSDAHLCQAGQSLDCSDGNNCTADECDPAEGCQNPLIDADGDGHASEDLGACGDDCNDGNDTVFAGAEELCDGLDNDCDDVTDEEAPRYFLDCDGDRFALRNAPFVQQCTEPSPPQNLCPDDAAGAWTTLAPESLESADCYDRSAIVNPRYEGPFQASPVGTDKLELPFDYNCNERHEPEYGGPPQLVPRCTSTGRDCQGQRFFADRDVPNCGEMGRLSVCVPSNTLLLCERATIEQPQRCR